MAADDRPDKGSDEALAWAKTQRNAAEARLMTSRDFLHGTVYQIHLSGGAVTIPHAALVYDDGRTKRLLTTALEVAQYVSETGFGKKRLMNEILSIPGILAIMITLTMLAVVLVQATRGAEFKIPEVLGAALATILGFYFGRHTAGG